MTDHAITSWSACALARAVACGDLGATEIVDVHIARLEATHPHLNALVARRFDAARSEARAIDSRRARGEALGALAGVPMTVKDSIDVAGLPSTFGLTWRADEIAPEDDPCVARLREQGAIVLGKSNVPQMLLYLESDNPLHGRTLNPWNKNRTCGGSSGGEAALIAAHASPLGLGTDLGGSLRYPAHFCGIASLKPTSGRCPDRGQYSVPTALTAIRSQLGPLARHVDDLALAFRHMIAPSSDGAPTFPPCVVDVTGLRVGWYDDDPMFPAAPAIRRAVAETVRALADAGVSVQPFRPPPLQEGFELAFSLLGADGGAFLRRALREGPAHPAVASLRMTLGRSRSTLRLVAALLHAIGQHATAATLGQLGYTRVSEYWARIERLQEWVERFTSAMDHAEGGALDALICPPCALPALEHGTSRWLGLVGPHTLVFNALGWPAGTLPWTTVRPTEESERPPSRDFVMKLAKRCELGSAGLPVGVQVVGRPWREDRVLALMKALESSSQRDSASPSLGRGMVPG